MPARRLLFAATAAARAATANAGKDENQPHNVARIASAHRAAATAVVQEHQEQNNVATITAASVCTVCKESVHVMYPLFSFRIAPTLPYAFKKNCVTTH